MTVFAPSRVSYFRRLDTRTHFIPAASAARIPGSASSNTRHFSGATPIFFAMRLTDLFRERGERPPPLGIYQNAVGGTDGAAWAPYAAVAAAGCVNATCMCKYR